MTPTRKVWVCVRIFAELFAIDSNRRLSWNVMECDGYDECENTIPDMVTIVCFSLNQVIALVQVQT